MNTQAISAILLVAIPALCHGLLLRDQSNWNGLKVTWGINPFGGAFDSMPRTQADAEKQGWVNMAPGAACDAKASFRGVRYWKGNDHAVILVFDANGYIAGISAGIQKGYQPNVNNYPFNALKNQPFVLDGDYYFVTAYFVDPATVCTGRSASQFHSQGTGTGLWIQNGTNPVRSSIKIPMTKTAADSSRWTKGACFYSMGLHYWYELNKDMDCNNLFPVFLLYNDGVLNAFGWAFAMDIENSKRFEHPPQGSYGNFMTTVPDCLPALGTMTTMHIYLTDGPISDTC